MARIVHNTILPPAIRADITPFPIAWLFGGLEVLSFIRWTTYRCPHCDHIFRIDFWPYNVRLGGGERTCSKCGQIFDDGSREWPELRVAQRLRFLLPPLLIGTSGGFVVAAILSAYVTPRDEHSWLVVVIVSGLSLIPVVVWVLVRLIWIFRSYHRYESGPSSMRRTSETGGIN